METKPHHTNNRDPCSVVMKQAATHAPVFTVEQQFTLLDPTTSIPIGQTSLSMRQSNKRYVTSTETSLSVLISRLPCICLLKEYKSFIRADLFFEME